MQSKNSDTNIYDCTAVTLLNNTQIDFYNSSSDKPRTAKQNWVKNIPESDSTNSTEKLQYDRQFLNKILNTQMDESGHSNSGVHVLQWRLGCEGEQSSDGSLIVLNSINEFSYDGEDLIQYNCTSKTWFTPEKKKNRTREEKWSKIYPADKKCNQCEEILKMYLKYKTTDITQSHTPPAVHIFKKKSVRDSSKLILICLITGFYPKDVKMSLRKFTTKIPDHLITSSGIRPNDDGTYQLRKSVEIQEDDPADYYCYVSHSSLTEPVIKQWDRSSVALIIWAGLFLVLIIVLLCSMVICVLIKKRRNRTGSDSASPSASSDSVLKDSADVGSPASSSHCNEDDVLVHFSPGPDSTLPCKRIPDLPINKPCPVKPVHMIIKFVSEFIKAGISLECPLQDGKQDQDW